MSKRGEAIVLIGFMGSGKSTVGRRLATRRGWPCRDTDEMIAARYGISITDFFAKRGEEAFREAETEMLRSLPAQPWVIVTGGGIILREVNVELLRTLGTLVHLIANEDTLFERATRRGTRPLLQTNNPRQAFNDLFQQRRSLYLEAADLTIDTSELQHEEVVARILKELAQHSHVD